MKRKVPQFAIELAIALCIYFAFGARVSKGIGRGGINLRFAVASVAFAVAAVAALLWNRPLSKPRYGRHCSICGYDLRATPERCPECGNQSNQEGRA